MDTAQVGGVVMDTAQVGGVVMDTAQVGGVVGLSWLLLRLVG